MPRSCPVDGAGAGSRRAGCADPRPPMTRPVTCRRATDTRPQHQRFRPIALSLSPKLRDIGGQTRQARASVSSAGRRSGARKVAKQRAAPRSSSRAEDGAGPAKHGEAARPRRARRSGDTRSARRSRRPRSRRPARRTTASTKPSSFQKWPRSAPSCARSSRSGRPVSAAATGVISISRTQKKSDRRQDEQQQHRQPTIALRGSPMRGADAERQDQR